MVYTSISAKWRDDLCASQRFYYAVGRRQLLYHPSLAIPVSPEKMAALSLIPEILKLPPEPYMAPVSIDAMKMCGERRLTCVSKTYSTKYVAVSMGQSVGYTHLSYPHPVDTLHRVMEVCWLQVASPPKRGWQCDQHILLHG